MRIGIIGNGRIGSALAELLQGELKPTWVVDTLTEARDQPTVDAIVNAGPWHINRDVIVFAVERGAHYFDFSEDVDTTKFIKKYAGNGKSLLIPHCGLAPGAINIIGYGLWRRQRGHLLDLYVGALPQHNPGYPCFHTVTWSPAGMAHEYRGHADAILHSKRVKLSTLGEYTPNVVGFEHLEAFTTAGGLGSLHETLCGKINTLRYRTMRFRGHHAWLRSLGEVSEEQLVDELSKHRGAEDSDEIVMAIETATHLHKGTIRGRPGMSAIRLATASGMAVMLDLAAQGELGTQGLIRQESISLEGFFDSPYSAPYLSLLEPAIDKVKPVAV